MSYIVTHTDMDGVAAAALYMYLTGEDAAVIFAEPYNLNRVLYKVYKRKPRKLILFDLGLNSDSIDFVAGIAELVRGKGGAIQWFDHHVWDSTWVDRLKSLGVELYIDRSTCATGVVARYGKPVRGDIDSKFVEEIVEGVCGADLWRFDHPLSPFFMRLVRRRDSDEWRLKVLNTLKQGTLWTQEFEEIVLERFIKEVEELSKPLSYRIFEVNGVKVAVVEKSKDVENSILAARVMGLTRADIVVVADRSGKLSLRSRGVNVRNLAAALGGGGHPQAAGAKIDLPLIVRIASLISNTAVLNYVENVLKQYEAYIRKVE
jgi:hypothetical protein